jgi:2,4-dienoyl-CoA reductase (NADPH2)
MLEAAGVDCFHISGGVTDASISKIIAGSSYRNGFNVAAARAVKLVANVPVMVVGRNWDPVAAAQVIAREEADMIVIGRPMFADPDLPNKLRANKLDDARMCNSCEVCVDGMMADASGVTCALNARCCREGEFPREAATVSKRVLVIGGGPAGMEAARVACARGHRVTLMERHEQLGGAFRFASIVHPDNQVFLQYLIHQMTCLPIELVLGKTVTEKEIAELKPDAIIVATGAAMTVPDINGADLPHVIKGAAVRQLIADIDAVGAKSAGVFDGTVAVLGCGLMGVELAICLAKLGSKVHVLDSATRIAQELGRGKKRRTEHSSELDAMGVPINTGVAIDEIGEKEIQISTADGRSHYLKADTVILIDSPQADTRLFDRAQPLADEVYSVGDCTGFGLCKKAVEEATRIAYKL